jgi:hypothetical protein
MCRPISALGLLQPNQSPIFIVDKPMPHGRMGQRVLIGKDVIDFDLRLTAIDQDRAVGLAIGLPVAFAAAKLVKSSCSR